jgi:gliding motility-associated-like protein
MKIRFLTKIIVFFLLIEGISSGNLLAQDRFLKTINLPPDVALTRGDIDKTEDGFLVYASLARFSSSPNAVYNSSLVYKLDSCYNIKFSREYRDSLLAGRTGNSLAYRTFDFLSVANNSFYLSYERFGNNKIHSTVSKGNLSGDLQWSKTRTANKSLVNVIGFSEFSDTEIVTNKSNVYAINRIPDTAKKPVLFTKLDKNGKVLNSKLINYTKYPNKIYNVDDFIALSNGKLLTTFSDSTQGGVISKLNPSGSPVWTKALYTSKKTKITIGKILQINSNKYFFYGSSGDTLNARSSAILGFMDSRGDVQKAFKLTNGGREVWGFWNAIVLSNGNVAIMGSTDASTSGSSGGFIACIGPNGKLKWRREYKQIEIITGGTATKDSGILAYGARNATLIKTDAKGRISRAGNSGCQSVSGFGNFSLTPITLKDSTVQLTTSPGPSYKDTSLVQKDVSLSMETDCPDRLSDTFLCQGQDTIKLDARYAGSRLKDTNKRFHWSTGDTTAQITVTDTGKYWVTIFDDGCTSTDTIRVKRPEVQLQKQPSIDTLCSGESLLATLKPVNFPNSDSLTYQWQRPSGNTISNDSLYVRKGGTYHYEAGYFRCKYEDSFTLTQSNLKADLGNDTTLCAGDSLNINLRHQNGRRVNQGASFTWDDGDSTAKRTITQAGQYGVKVQKSGCSVSDTIAVQKADLTITTNRQTDTLCPYDSLKAGVKLTGIPDSVSTNLTWTLPDSTQIGKDSVYFKQEGTYRVRLTNPFCRLSDSFHLAQYRLPKAQAGPDSTICYGDSLTLKGKGGITYRWRPPDYLAQPNAQKTISNPPDSQHYNLITANQFGCVDTDRVKINVKAPLRAEVNYRPSRLCEGDTLYLEAKDIRGGDTANHAVKWYGEGGDLIANAANFRTTLPDSQFSANQAVRYRLNITDGCSLPYSDTLSIPLANQPEVETDFSPKSGCSPLEVSFQAKEEQAENYAIKWQIGGNRFQAANFTDTFQAKVRKERLPVTYQIGTDTGCTWETTLGDSLTVRPAPEVQFQAIPDTTKITKPTITFENKSSQADFFQWHFDDGKTSTRVSPVHQYDSAGLYEVRLTGIHKNGCRDSFSGKVLIRPEFNLYIPDAFSPNGDGLNEVFRPKGTAIQGYRLTIYNRWGERIYQGKNEGWDGTYEGALSPAGQYLYLLEYSTKAGTEGPARGYESGELMLLR